MSLTPSELRLLNKLQTLKFISINKNDNTDYKTAKKLESQGLAVLEEIENEHDYIRLLPGIIFEEPVIKIYSLAELKAMPTIQERQWGDIKIKTHTLLVELSRATVGDGAPYNNQVICSRPPKPTAGLPDWITVLEYQAR